MSGGPVNRLRPLHPLQTRQSAARFFVLRSAEGRAVSEVPDGTNRTKRKPRVPVGFAGQHLVLCELKKRGFDAQLGPVNDMLVRAGDAPPTPVRVKTTHVTRWYVRWTSFVGDLANQVTVFVLIGLDGNPNSVRFFIVRNRDLMAYFRPAANGQRVRKQSNRKA
jgi:hypothetical protein